ncbi:hypothetical protein [Streptomyces violarus]|uniref:hypothetical protein n=1 Tax=Streptomyces violarus TaxID=67380 RepID=UPI0021C1B192|nr:hypothetical protein [Streptomyces violarus]MCT9137841.1 hypothetical protein [Streptomyces violarus]
MKVPQAHGDRSLRSSGCGAHDQGGKRKGERHSGLRCPEPADLRTRARQSSDLGHAGERTGLVEAGSRTGGALTAPAIRAATGFDLDRELVVFHPERGTLAALPADPPPFVVEERLRGTVGTAYQGGVKSGVYVAGYVLRRWTGHHGEDDHGALG